MKLGSEKKKKNPDNYKAIICFMKTICGKKIFLIY